MNFQPRKNISIVAKDISITHLNGGDLMLNLEDVDASHLLKTVDDKFTLDEILKDRELSEFKEYVHRVYGREIK